MAIKEDFAAFKTTVDARLVSIEGKLLNPPTPPEVVSGMAAIVSTLEAIDNATTPPTGGDPL
jgi:hypothetical protein